MTVITDPRHRKALCAEVLHTDLAAALGFAATTYTLPEQDLPEQVQVLVQWAYERKGHRTYEAAGRAQTHPNNHKDWVRVTVLCGTPPAEGEGYTGAQDGYVVGDTCMAYNTYSGPPIAISLDYPADSPRGRYAIAAAYAATADTAAAAAAEAEKDAAAAQEAAVLAVQHAAECAAQRDAADAPAASAAGGAGQ